MLDKTHNFGFHTAWGIFLALWGNISIEISATIKDAVSNF
jgi:hypothetical protein